MRKLILLLTLIPVQLFAASCSPKYEAVDPEDLFRIPELENREDDGTFTFTDVKARLEALDEVVTGVTSSFDTLLTPTVKETVLHITTRHTNPLYFCVLEVKLKDPGTTLEVTYPDNIGSTWPVRNMVKQAQAISSNGHQVIGAINADFFFMGDTGFPLSGVWHQGKCIKSDWSNPDCSSYFGVDWGGRAMIGNYTDYTYLNKAEIYDLVGGHCTLVRNGVVQWQSENYKAPRTAVGADKDGYTAFLVVVDELVPASPRDGINFEDLAKCMLQIGCFNSVNMDGGGSSTFVVRDGDGFKVENKEPGAYLRPVADGIAVIYKK